MNKWILYIAFLFFPAALQAQQLSLRDAVEIALRNNMGIQLARNNTTAAGISNSYGMAGGLPLITATGTDVEQVTSIKQEYANPANNKTSNNASSNNLSASLNASMLLYNGNKVQNAHRRLGLIESQSRQQLNSRALTLVYNVMLRYYDIIRQQSYARTLSASIDVSREKLEIVKAQQSAGVANNADLFQAQVDLNTQVQNLQAQQLVIAQAKTDLLTLLTLKPDSALNISDTIVVDRSVELGPVINAIQSNPDISAADQQIAINEYIEKETAAQRYPSLSANAGYNFSHTKNAAGFSLLNQSYGPFAGVGVSIPIFNGSIFRKQTEIAGINVKNAQLQKDTLVLNYTANAVKNWQAYNNNLQQLETAKTNYDLSGKLLDLVLQRFQLKQATIVDLKNAQDSFENAGYLLVNVSFSAKAAELRLKYYANQLQY
ncbi:TolC family protein [uncultured Chitinophaga sp.]|jgi:Outer membrane protein|uniref:TolC family protein n=1 Tax=uncultured Chitinophaga sp. TaxID=339340 RepID=UPI002634CDCA|nr:TolC family protein [uncultured Chitinophaga sp.]